MTFSNKEKKNKKNSKRSISMFIRLRGEVKKYRAQEHESSRANGIKHVFNTDSWAII
jgi:hypothetical protein